MAEIKAIDAENAVFGSVFLVKLDDLPLLEIRSRHKPIEEIFLKLELLRLRLLLLRGKVLIIRI
jgi:hypothetical protein